MKSEKVYIEYLLMKAQAGDVTAGNDLLHLLGTKVKAFVLKLMSGSVHVDDCVQESILKVHQHMSQLRDVKAIHTWVYRIVYSTCMDCLRKNPTRVDSAVEPSANQPDMDQLLDVKAAIATLSESQQVIIYLFYYEGFKVAEMADILAKPAGTIKSWLFDARDHIKAKLSSNELSTQQESSHEY